MKCGPDGCPIIAFSDLTPAEQRVQRKRIAKTMYEQGFTEQQIAKQLGVSQRQISTDLEGLEVTSKPARPKGGRPKGKRQARRRSGPPPEIEQQLAEAVLDEGLTLEQATEAFDLSSVQHAKLAVAREEGRREAEPLITPDMLAMTAQQKLDAAIRQHKRKLDMEFEAKCREEVLRWLNDVSLPQYMKEISKIEHTIRTREGVMDRITYRKILACLHPDRVQEPALKKRYEEAFRLFTDLEKRVLDEKQSPTEFRTMPRTSADLMRMKAKIQAERRAKRHSKHNGVTAR